jgi:hypothetical protein
MTNVTPNVYHPSSTHETHKIEKETKEREMIWNSRLIIAIGVATFTVATAILLVEVAILVKEIIQDKIWQPNLHELENHVSKKFSPDFCEKIKNLSHQGLDYIRLFKRLSITQDDETKIISYLEQNFEISPEQLKEILMGAHVRLEDDGKTYREWLLQVMNKQARISSHDSDGTQYGVRGALIKELLFSRTTGGDGKSYTWFQLENHPVSFGHIIRHMKDYIKYKLTKQNQGPYGSSNATDRFPIVLKPKENA